MEEVQNIRAKELEKETLTELRSLTKYGKVDLFDRDLSWLRFNKRVLLEAQDESVPLYERIKFMAIYSSNMDEFFRVRFSNMRRIARLSKLGKKKIKKLTGFHDPEALIKEVLKVTHEQQELYGKVYRESIIPSLKKEGVILYTTKHISAKHAEAVEEYFYTQVLSFLQPIVITAENKDDIFLENRKLYHAVDLLDDEGKKSIGIVNIPSPPLSRFVSLDNLDGMHHYAFVDDIVRAYVNILFPGYSNKGVYAIKLNRDAELYLENEFSGTLIEKIKNNIVKRDIGNPSRFLFDKDMPAYMVSELQEYLGLVDNDLVPGGRYHNMFDHLALPNPIGPQLEYPKLKPLSHPALQGFTSVLDAMYKEDILLHFPYQRYDYILRYFNEAIISKQVKEIKAALYRVAENSHVVNALISAARNGKKVTVFVEAKARFDEENNLKWAARMQEVGIDVRFSNLELKVHSKVALLIGEDPHGNPTKYAFFGTGNFNEKTASIYADHALLTCDTEMCDELDMAFEVIFGNTRDVAFKHLLVAQVNMVEVFIKKIEREIENAKAGHEARMTIKLNNLQDPNIIQKIYDAADAGVDIVLIVRAISCAKPRKNLRVIRLVDKFLEHARVYWFYNNGDEEMYLGSADWMERNLYRRIEVVFPLYNKELQREIHASLKFQLNDNQKAVEIANDMSNIRIEREGPDVRAQTDFYDWLVDEHQLHRSTLK
jgi:polyphosphate kinase